MPLLEPLRNNHRYHQLIQTTFHPSLLPNSETQTDSSRMKPKFSVNTKITESTSEGSNSLMEEVEIEQVLTLLDHLMNGEKKFLEPSITLRHLAENLNIHPNKLSWLLNDRLSMNFNDYINSFRLDTFKKKALDPAHKNYTLLGLAFESGFNSKSAFNDYFKKKTGTTPRRWLKQNK